MKPLEGGLEMSREDLELFKRLKAQSKNTLKSTINERNQLRTIKPAQATKMVMGCNSLTPGPDSELTTRSYRFWKDYLPSAVVNARKF